MTRLPEVVTVDEATVQKVATDDITLPRRRRRRRNLALVTNPYSITVRPDVWETVMELSPNPAHVQVVSESEVIIWNHPKPWPA